MLINDKIIYFFNKIFYDLLKDLNSVDNDVIKSYCSNIKVKNLETSKHISLFHANITEELLQEFLITPTTTIFDNKLVQDFFILKDLSFVKIKDNVPENFHTTLKHYMYCLVLITLIYRESLNEENAEDTNVLFTNVVDCIRKIQSKEPYSDIIDSIYDKDVKTIINFVEECSSEIDSTIDDDIIPDMLKNSTIGSLAKEISEEIDFGEFSIEKPEDIMKLMSGNIIGKVGEKIQKKMSSGEIKHEQLLAEAMSMLGNMGQTSDIFNNPFIKQMLSGKNMKVDESKLKTMATRDRLKKKLGEKNL